MRKNKIVRYPYFQFSKVRESPKAFSFWFAHFKEKNIACAIVKRKEKRFSLWRAGKEAGGLSNREPLRGGIIEKFDPEGIFQGEKI
jgi:hypothetical protein